MGRNLRQYLNALESYILQDPRLPHGLNPHLRHEVSIKTPKYTGAGIPAVGETNHYDGKSM